MARFAYNNGKNTSTGHTPFKPNCRILFEEDVNPRSRSYLARKLADKLKKLIEVYCQNLLYTQKMQKKTHGKGVKSRHYSPDNKVQLNSK